MLPILVGRQETMNNLADLGEKMGADPIELEHEPSVNTTLDGDKRDG